MLVKSLAAQVDTAMQGMSNQGSASMRQLSNNYTVGHNPKEKHDWKNYPTLYNPRETPASNGASSDFAGTGRRRR